MKATGYSITIGNQMFRIKAHSRKEAIRKAMSNRRQVRAKIQSVK